MKFAVAIALFAIVNACLVRTPTQQTGTLQASINIGPLCTREPCNLTPQQLSAYLAAYKVLIFDSTARILHSLKIDSTAVLKKSLRPGRYTAAIKPDNLPGGASLDHKEFEILPGATTRIILDYDTGIR